jgi:hypothetical protein
VCWRAQLAGPLSNEGTEEISLEEGKKLERANSGRRPVGDGHSLPGTSSDRLCMYDRVRCAVKILIPPSSFAKSPVHSSCMRTEAKSHPDVLEKVHKCN